MGEVAVLFRVMPQSTDTDMKALAGAVRAATPSSAHLRGMQIKDIAFGLKALLVSVVMPDTGGILEEIVKAYATVPHVESVEVMEEGLL